MRTELGDPANMSLASPDGGRAHAAPLPAAKAEAWLSQVSSGKVER